MPVDPRGRHVADRHRDLLAAGLGAELGHHRRARARCRDRDPALGQRERDPAGPDRQLERGSAVGKGGEEVDGGLQDLEREHRGDVFVVAGGDVGAEVICAVWHHAALVWREFRRLCVRLRCRGGVPGRDHGAHICAACGGGVRRPHRETCRHARRHRAVRVGGGDQRGRARLSRTTIRASSTPGPPGRRYLGLYVRDQGCGLEPRRPQPRPGSRPPADLALGRGRRGARGGRGRHRARHALRPRGLAR